MGKLEHFLKSAGGNIASSSARREPALAAPVVGGLPLARPDGATRSRAAFEIEIDRIVADPDQPRQDFEPEALERMAVSLKHSGQLVPVRVRRDEGQGGYVLIAGERRWRAARMAGLKTLSCVVHDGPLSDADRLAQQLMENCVREDLRPIEQARGFSTLMREHGWS